MGSNALWPPTPDPPFVRKAPRDGAFFERLRASGTAGDHSSCRVATGVPPPGGGHCEESLHFLKNGKL